MNTGFEMIAPTPTYPAGVTAALLSGRDWDDRATVVALFKSAIKTDLRTAQRGRCCFCRRRLFDDYATHIEHFIEKAHYGEYAFEIRNLALCCGTCNGQKNAYNRSLNASLKERARRHRGTPSQRCATLTAELTPGTPIPVVSHAYRWVHPHVDRYSQHIVVQRGYVFVGKTVKGVRTIRGVKLNALATIEQRALLERLSARSGVLSFLIGVVAELDQHNASAVASAVAMLLRQQRSEDHEQSG